MIFRPEPDKPYTLKLRYTAPHEKPGRYGMQYLYTLYNGDGLYVPPVAHQEIQALHLGIGDPFSLMKKSMGQRILWVIDRPAVPPAPPVPQSQPETGPQPVKKPATRAELMTELGQVLMTGTDGALPTPAAQTAAIAESKPGPTPCSRTS